MFILPELLVKISKWKGDLKQDIEDDQEFARWNGI